MYFTLRRLAHEKCTRTFNCTIDEHETQAIKSKKKIAIKSTTMSMDGSKDCLEEFRGQATVISGKRQEMKQARLDRQANRYQSFI